MSSRLNCMADLRGRDDTAKPSSKPKRSAHSMCVALLLHLGPYPAFGKGDAQLRADHQLIRIRHHTATGIMHQAVAARQHPLRVEQHQMLREDRKSTRLNSSHQKISYAVFC